MKKLTPMQLDALAESANISMGSAATALSHLLGHSVEITTPSLSYTTVASIRGMYPLPCVLTRVRYSEGLQGSNLFILSDRDAGMIANMMMGDPDKPLPEELDELYLSAVSEAMNQMMGSSATAMSEVFQRKIDITPPDLEYLDLGNPQKVISEFEDESEVLMVSFKLRVGDYIASSMLQVLSAEFAGLMVSELLGQLGIDDQSEPEQDQPSGGDTAPQLHYTDAEGVLSAQEADTIAEIGNISMGSAATALSLLLDNRVDITSPRVSVTTMRQVREHFPEPCVVVNVQYTEGLSGENVLIVRDRDAAVIASLMMGEDGGNPPPLDEIRISAVSEAMNQMMGSACTALAEIFSRAVDISPPLTEYRNMASLETEAEENLDVQLVQVAFRMEVTDLIDSELIQLIPLSFAREMVEFLLGSLQPPPVEQGSAATAMPVQEPVPPQPVLPEPDARPAPSNTPAPWADLAVEDEYDDNAVHLDLIRDVPVRITGLLGRRTVTIKQLMSIKSGSVVDLDCAADAPVDILANGKLVARGEVVVCNERFGIKITEILSPW